MPDFDLPPWLTRQYDYAKGFRGIGDAVLNSRADARAQAESDIRQHQEALRAQTAAQRQQGLANYGQRVKELTGQGVSAHEAAQRAFIENAHLIQSEQIGQTLRSEDATYSRLKAAEEAIRSREMIADQIEQGRTRMQDITKAHQGRMDEERAKRDAAVEAHGKAMDEQRKANQQTLDQLRQTQEDLNRERKAQIEMKMEPDLTTEEKTNVNSLAKLYSQRAEEMGKIAGKDTTSGYGILSPKVQRADTVKKLDTQIKELEKTVPKRYRRGGTKAVEEPAAPSAAKADFDTVPPNPKDREKDKTYSLPKGIFKWTGSGWVTP